MTTNASLLLVLLATSPLAIFAEDMSQFFSSFKDCGSCIDAGYGWCPLRRRCGGFANKECGLGENYIAEGAARAATPKPKRAKKPSPPPPPAGNDMRATFAKYRNCGSCIDAGYGWCTIQRKCGGFANKQCGIGPQYVSAGPAPRNGLWEPASKRAVAEEAATAEVPAAAPSPPASLLYAGPASPPPSGKVVVEPTGETTVTSSASAEGNETELSPYETELLRALPHEALVQKVLELQAAMLSVHKA